MYKILEKKHLNDSVVLMKIYSPLIAKKAKPGQFIILKVDEKGERIPLTIHESNIEEGSVSIIFQIVGATTMKLNNLQVGDSIEDFVGPLGKPTEIESFQNIAIIGGGVGCAIAYPLAKAYKSCDKNVTSIIGFRNKNLIILEEKFKEVSDELYITTDDGSCGFKGYVSQQLQQMLNDNKAIDCVYAVGPLFMMKAVCEVTKKYNIKTIVSMNPIMIDGTGMCGCCRLTYNNKVHFACIDGPDFDGHLVDFDETINRLKMYKDVEKQKHDEMCNLLRRKVND